MRALRARVEGGRYVIDEKPVEPEGTILFLHTTDDEEDELSPEELAELDAACAEADEDRKAGRLITAEQFFSEWER